MHRGHREHLCGSLDGRLGVNVGAGPGPPGAEHCLDRRLVHGKPAGIGQSQSSGRCMRQTGLWGLCGGVKVAGGVQLVGLGCFLQPRITQSLIHRVAIAGDFCHHVEYAGPQTIRSSTQLQHVPDLAIVIPGLAVFCSAAQQLAEYKQAACKQTTDYYYKHKATQTCIRPTHIG